MDRIPDEQSPTEKAIRQSLDCLHRAADHCERGEAGRAQGWIEDAIDLLVHTPEGRLCSGFASPDPDHPTHAARVLVGCNVARFEDHGADGR